MKYTLTLLLFLLLTLPTIAQRSLVKRGELELKRFRFDEAASLFKKAADADSNDVVAREKLAEAFMLTNDFQSAEAVYRTLSENPTANQINKFYYGQVLCINGKYGEATKAFNAFVVASPNDTRAIEFKNFADEINAIATDVKAYDLAGIPENSPHSEIGPAYWVGKLTFSSNRKAGSAVKNIDSWSGKAFYDLYETGSSPEATVAATKIKGKKVNRRLNEGPAVFSADGNEIIFTQSNYKHKNAEGVRTLGLFSANWTAKKGFTNVQPLPFNNYSYNVAQPALSPDGKRLYFASDMPNGRGETDLYMSLRNGSTWENPINLGKEINTTGREMFPFIAPDGTLYFSSDSRVGLGGLDIYRAYPEGNTFSGVQNLGATANSSADDFGYVCDETLKNGFLVSNRTGGQGEDDIYKFIKNSEAVCGTVADAKTKAGIENVLVTATNAEGQKSIARTNLKGGFCVQLAAGKEYKIETSTQSYYKTDTKVIARSSRNDHINILLDPKGGIELAVDVSQKGDGKIEGATAFLINKKTGEVTEMKSDDNGIVKFDLFKDQEYDLKVVKKLPGQEGVYDKFVKTISTMGFKESDKLNENAQLTYYDGKFVFDLPNVYFDLNSATIKPIAAADLDKVVSVMQTFPDMQVELSAHTDSRGKSAFNLGLSAQRASNCVDYLAARGVNKARLIAIGYGEERLRNKCADGVNCTEAEHSVNRRTEFKVVKFD